MKSIEKHYEARYSTLADASREVGMDGTLNDRIALALDWLPPASRVLDYGSGTGAATNAFVEAGHQVTAADIAQPALDYIARCCPHANVIKIDDEGKTGLPDKAFDVVFSSEVLEHVFDVAGTLTEYHRLLGDGGKLVLTTPYHGVAKNVAIALKGYERHYHPYHGHIRFFTRKSLNDCLVDAGFEVKHWRGLGRIWPLWKTMFVVAEKA